jgi:NAD(P)H-hydrate repair Nnr-like enzyme with NAD(P)H-hydrate dehydratase domain
VGPNPTFINNFSNSILATGGTGDILAGIAGAFLAQNYIMPAELATFIHTLAAKKILEENSSRIAASELLSKIGVAINELETKSKENRIFN